MPRHSKIVVLLIVCISVFSLSMHAQQETSKWYFGANHAVDFASGVPKVIQPSAIYGQEGSASIADANGNLLFYTSGDTVWNKNHQMMQNGGGLFGDQTPVQPAIIIKKPGSTHLYYVFTVQGIGGAAGCRYSLIDMQLNGGLGGVISKNLVLYGQPCTEGITAALHCNGQDYWVIVHQDSSTVFRSYLLSSSGLSTAVTSSVGSISRFESLKMSLDGTKLASAGINPPLTLSNLGVYNFNRSNGQILTSIFTYSTTDFLGFLEFSPNSNVLYSSNFSKIFQWDLCAGTSNQIAATCQTITPSISGQMYHLQLALDGKIYVSRNQYSLLSVINSPNSLGANCNFMDTGIVLKNYGVGGLPNMPSYHLRHLNYSPFTYTTSHNSSQCYKVDFSANAQPLNCGNPSSVSFNAWHFGDPISGALNVSNSPNASHSYKQPGNYTAWLLLQNTCGGFDSIPQIIQVPYSVFGPSVSIQAPATICVGESAPITLSGATTYTFNQVPLLVNPFVLTPNQTTTYTITASNAASCVSKTTFSIWVDPCIGINDYEMLPFFELKDQTLFIHTTKRTPTMALYNLQGQRLISAHPGDDPKVITLDVSYLPEGVYVISDGVFCKKWLYIKY